MHRNRKFARGTDASRRIAPHQSAATARSCFELPRCGRMRPEATHPTLAALDEARPLADARGGPLSRRPKPKKPASGMLRRMKLECPECGKKLEVAPDFPTRPFCSPRCKQIDLGRWFNEEFRIPGPSVDDDLDIEFSTKEVGDA